MAGFGTFWARPSRGIWCSGSGLGGAAAEAWGLSWQVKAWRAYIPFFLRARKLRQAAVVAGFETFWARPSRGIWCSGSGLRGAAAEAWGLSWQVKAWRAYIPSFFFGPESYVRQPLWLDLGRFGLALAGGSGVAEAVSEELLLRPGT